MRGPLSNIRKRLARELAEGRSRSRRLHVEPAKPGFRIESVVINGTGEEGAIRSQREVAAIMTKRGFPMSRSRVHQIELRALQKIKASKELEEFKNGLA